MAVSKEVTLTMRLLDQITGPAAGIVSSLGRVNAATKSFLAGGAMAAGMRDQARGIRAATYNSTMLSGAFALLGANGAKAVFEFEKMGNAAQAVGLLTDAQRELLEANAKSLNLDFPFTNRDILSAAFELNRAGFNFDQMMGSLRDTLNVSLAGDLGLQETADIVTNVMRAMRLPMETTALASESAKRVGDNLAYAATRSNTDIHKMGITFKYVAPIAAATGMSMEELSSAVMILANNGIKGSDAGTGLRFALTRMLKPSKEASKAIARLGLDMKNYVSGAQAISSQGVIEFLKLDGIDASGFAKQIDQLLANKDLNKSPARLAGAMAQMLSEELGDGSILDVSKLADSLEDSLSVLGTKVDFFKFLDDIRKRPEGEALLPTIFGVRHGAKIMGLLAGDIEKTLNDVEQNYRDAADRMSKIRMKGVVGDWYRLKAAIENTWIAISDSGVLATATKGIQSFTTALQGLAKSNPDMLRTATYAALAMAALAPLGFIASGTASALSLLISPIAWVAGGLAYLAATNWNKITTGLSSLGDGFTKHLSPEVWQDIQKIGEGLKNMASGLLGLDLSDKDFAAAMYDIGKGVADGINAAHQAIKSLIASIQQFADMTGIDLSWLGELSKWGLILIGASVGFSLIVGPIKSLSKALLLLSGITPAWHVLKFIGQLAKYAGKAAGIGALAKSMTAVGNAAKAGAAAGAVGTAAAAAGAAGAAAGAATKGGPKGAVAPRSSTGTGLSLVNGILGVMNVFDEVSKYGEALKKDGGKAWREKGDARNQAINDWLIEKAPWMSVFGDGRPKVSVFGQPSPEPPVDHGPKKADKATSFGPGPTTMVRTTSLPAPKTITERAAEANPGGAFSELMGGTVEKKVSIVPELDTVTVTAMLAQIGNMVASPQLDTAGMTTQAAATGSEIQRMLSLTARPHVDTSSMDAALSKARAIASAMRQLSAYNGSSGSNPDWMKYSHSSAPRVVGKRASGGSVRAGSTYLVGERGKETVTMGGNGYVTPNHRLVQGGDTGQQVVNSRGGDVHMAVTINVNGGDRDAAQEISNKLHDLLERSRQISMNDQPVTG